MMEPTQLDSGQSGGSMWFFNHVPAILWHRKLYIIIPFLGVLLAAIVVAYALPTLYRSTATLLVQSADLPPDIADAQGTDIQDRIAKIRDEVLSRGDLISLIEQDDLYRGERQSKPMSAVVDKMRKATTVDALANDIGKTGATKDNTIAIALSFDYPDPAKAQAVMQEYVTKFLRKDSDESQDQADVAVRFLQDQATKLQSQIQQIQDRMTSLKAQNGAALAGTGMPVLMDTGSYTAQITDLENQNRQLIAQAQHEQEDPQLAAAEAALAQARATYTDTHPDVILARERVAELKRAAGSSDNNSAAEQQIRANNAAIASLTAARNQAVAKVNASMAGQARAPAILEQASQLESQANGLRDQYKQVADNLMKAQASARLADEQRGEHLSLVEPANLPDQPQWPNRPLLIAAGAVAGLVIGLLAALAVELLNRPMRSPGQIEELGFPVLGLVPTFPSAANKLRFRLFGRQEAVVG